MQRPLTARLRLGWSWWATALLCVVTAVAATPLRAQPVTRYDVPQYTLRATWQETLLATRAALQQVEQAAPNAPRLATFISPVVRSGEAPRPVRVSVAGQKELYLYVIGAPEVVRGAADWAEAKLIDADGKATWLGDIKGLKATDGQHSVNVNLFSGVSGPLRIAGRQFEHGIEVYPNGCSKVVVPLDGRYQTFEALLGVDDWVTAPGPAGCGAGPAGASGGNSGGAVRFIVTGPEGAARCDLWERLKIDFADGLSRQQMKWAREDGIFNDDWKAGDYGELAQRYAMGCARVLALADQAAKLAPAVRDAGGLRAVERLYYRGRTLEQTAAKARTLNLRALRMAIDDLRGSFGDKYPQGPQFAQRLAAIEKALPEALTHVSENSPAGLAASDQVAKLVADFDALQRDALLANPLLDFDRLLLIERTPHGDPRMPIGTGFGLGEYVGLPRQTSKHSPDIDQLFAWDNRIAVLSPVRPDGKLTTVYQSDGQRLLNDMKLHWDARRIIFAMPGTQRKWQIWEVGADGKSLRQVTPGDQPDVHNYDPCYLPNGKIAFLSTACLQGVPCNAGVIVGMMYTMNADGSGIRQVCFEQDHDYCPTVLNDGRVMYLRWDYTDTPHVWNRMLFTMNPDGTDQMELYGANSYWPNAIFYARAIPNDPTKVVGIVTGHHVGRVGELVVFDPAKGRAEADGVVQRIPGYGQKVEPLIQDKLTEHSWPKFLHPQALSDKYFIVSCKPTPDALWGVYLVDVFDNLVLLKEAEGKALLEPIPLRPTPQPPVIADKVQPNRKDALVHLQDVYLGAPMQGIPRGTVKKLRVFTYHFAYQRIAGIDHRVGADGPWEVKRVLGTVDVERDGSAYFRVPAKTPFSVQPLDSEGKAVQLMRSWMTAQPGEVLSCAGCHDNRTGAPPVKATLALQHGPQEIRPWYGPPRGFSFAREVQPVLDRFCVGCHDGKPRPDGAALADLRREQNAFVCYRGGDPVGEVVQGKTRAELLGKYGGIFEPSYLALRRFVRVGGLESDLHTLPAMEFHADTTELFQMLRQGHHGVQLDAEAWDRLATWVDLNAPCHGTWCELTPLVRKQNERRRELQRLYGAVEDEGEDLAAAANPGALANAPAVKPIMPAPVTEAKPAPLACAGWPFDATEAQRRQAALGPATRTFDLGNGSTLELVRIPAGQFIMGDLAGYADERPQAVVKIDRPFWLGKVEVTNAQFARFDPSHDSRFEHRTSWIFSEEYLGWRLNHPKQPVVRVSWQEAQAFCRWLSQRTGQAFALPTEAQWEYACRAGTATPLSYGGLDTDFAPFANLADYNIRNLAYEGWRPRSPDLAPRDSRFNDHALVTADVGSYQANAWGLCDMHGNAAEWTRTAYRPYPYREDDGRNALGAAGLKVVRGGSWYDRPARCRSASRQAYQPYQKVFDVGFRVVCEETAVAQAP